MYISLKPTIDPRISCPKSVLYLPEVVEGIKRGDITIQIVEEDGDEMLVADLLTQ